MRTAICIATGTSLTKEDVEFCRGKGKIYAVKEARKLAPWADVLYAADTDWWELNHGCPDFDGERWTVSNEAAKKYDLFHMEYDQHIAWSTTQGILATGGNSGFQALNLAVLQGASKVILLGYDMGHPPEQKHFWTGTYERPVRYSNYKDWITRFNKAAPLINIPVINCTRGGSLECFTRASLAESL